MPLVTYENAIIQLIIILISPGIQVKPRGPASGISRSFGMWGSYTQGVTFSEIVIPSIAQVLLRTHVS